MACSLLTLSNPCFWKCVPFLLFGGPENAQSSDKECPREHSFYSSGYGTTNSFAFTFEQLLDECVIEIIFSLKALWIVTSNMSEGCMTGWYIPLVGLVPHVIQLFDGFLESSSELVLPGVSEELVYSNVHFHQLRLALPQHRLFLLHTTTHRSNLCTRSTQKMYQISFFFVENTFLLFANLSVEETTMWTKNKLRGKDKQLQCRNIWVNLLIEIEIITDLKSRWWR